MRRIGRLIGWLFLFFGVGSLGHDLIKWLETGLFEPIPFGQVWALIDRPSLNLVQAVIERYVSPALWNDVLFKVVLAPASVVGVVPGILILLLFRRRGL